MTEQEKIEWIKRNLDCYSNEAEAREDLERRLMQKERKETRTVKTFKNLDEYRSYSETHNVGQWWDSEDFTSVQCYEYK